MTQPAAPTTLPATPLPAFTPVPRLKERSNGWKPDVQRAFIEALADTGSVASACKRVGRSTHGAYQLRRSPGAEEFAAAWEAALDLGMQRIEDVAMDRALNGVEVPVYSYGKLVGTRRVHNDRLLMFMLRNRAPGRFAEGKPKGLNAIGKMEKRRLKKKWRKAWEEEQEAQRAAEEADEEANRPTPAEARASIARKVEQLRQQVTAERTRKADEWRSVTRETREAFRRYRELLARDTGAELEMPEWAVSEEELAEELRREREQGGVEQPLIEEGSGLHGE